MSFYIKKNDTSPAVQSTLKDSTGTAVVVTGGTVRFHMFPMNDLTTAKVDAAATIDDGANGLVSYSWAAGDTDTEGTFYCEWEVTYSDSAVESFPNKGYETVIIQGDLT